MFRLFFIKAGFYKCRIRSRSRSCIRDAKFYARCERGIPFVNEGFVVLNFIFPLFLEIVVYANEFKTKEKQKLPEMKKSTATDTFSDKNGI